MGMRVETAADSELQSRTSHRSHLDVFADAFGVCAAVAIGSAAQEIAHVLLCLSALQDAHSRARVHVNRAARPWLELGSEPQQTVARE